MKPVLAILAAAMTLMIAVPLSAAAPPVASSAHALFDKPYAYDPSGCTHLMLDLQVTPSAVNADYWGRNTCTNSDSDHLTGSTTLTPDQVSFTKSSASLTNVIVTVSSLPGGYGYFQQFTLNLDWAKDGHPTVSHTGPGAGVHEVPATVTGSAVDLTNIAPFAGTDAVDAELVLHAGG